MGNTVLVIGNGFDLYHHLPTRYTDFLFFMNNWDKFKANYDEQEKLDDCSQKFDVALGEWYDLTEESILDFAKYKGYYNEEHLQFLNQNSNNAWLEYFIENAVPGRNWVDFENEIYGALQQVEKYYSSFLLSKVGTVPMMTMPPSMRLVVNTFSKKTDGRYYKNLSQSILHERDADLNKLKRNKELLIDTMKNELDSFNKCLDYYLLDFVSNIKCDVYSEQIRQLEDISILNFNYTNTYKIVYGDEKILHYHPIHGNAIDENMVLGIPDDTFRNSMDYIYFQKYFQRIQKKTGNDYKKWILAPKYPTMEDTPAQVFIIGHSLNKLDYGVLKDIFTEQNVNRITIYYHSQSAYEGQVINLVEMFGKDFVIENTASERIVFEELKGPISV